MLNHTNTQAFNHRNLGSLGLAALASGCIALSLCPALAMAAPPEQAGPQQGEPPAAMQQMDEGQQMREMVPFDQPTDNQAPSGQPNHSQAPQGPAPQAQDQQDQQGQPSNGQAPQGPASQAQDQQDQQGQPSNGQAPQGPAPQAQEPRTDMSLPEASNGQAHENGMRQDRNDAVNEKVRQILSEQFGIDLSLEKIAKGANDEPINAEKAPIELPEGEINVQQVIDSIRDVLRTYSADELESADFSDDEFAKSLTDYINNSNTERLERFASETEPGKASDGKAESNRAERADGEPQASKTFAKETAQIEGEAPSAQPVNESVISKLVSFVMGLFGQQA